MNKKRKSELLEIAFDCKKATSLIEKRQDVDLNSIEKLELKYHLAGCAMCRLYEQQSLLVTRMMRHLLNKKSSIMLDNSYKENLKKQLEDKLRDQE